MTKTLQHQYEDHTETGKKSEHKTNCTEIMRIRLFWGVPNFFFMVLHYVINEKFLKSKPSIHFSSTEKLW